MACIMSAEYWSATSSDHPATMVDTEYHAEAPRVLKAALLEKNSVHQEELKKALGARVV